MEALGSIPRAAKSQNRGQYSDQAQGRLQQLGFSASPLPDVTSVWFCLHSSVTCASASFYYVLYISISVIRMEFELCIFNLFIAFAKTIRLLTLLMISMDVFAT